MGMCQWGAFAIMALYCNGKKHLIIVFPLKLLHICEHVKLHHLDVCAGSTTQEMGPIFILGFDIPPRPTFVTVLSYAKTIIQTQLCECVTLPLGLNDLV